MTHRPIRASTALVATLSLLLPQAVMVPEAQAQERIRLCADLATTPPCPEGEPRRGQAYLVNEDGTLTPAGEGGGEEAPVEEAPVEEAEAAEEPVEEVAPEGEPTLDPEALSEEDRARLAEDEAVQEAVRARRAEEQAAAEEAAAAEAAAAEEAARAEAEAQAQAEAEAAARAEAEAEAAQRAAEEQAAAEEAARAEAQAEEDARRAAEEAAAEAEEAPADVEELAQEPVEAPVEEPVEAGAEDGLSADEEALREAVRAERERRRAEAEAAGAGEGEGEGEGETAAEAVEVAPEEGASSAEEEALREAVRARRAEERAAEEAAAEEGEPSLDPDALSEEDRARLAEDEAVREAVRLRRAEERAAAAAAGEQPPVEPEEELVDPTVEEDRRPVAAAEEEAAPVEPVEEEVETVAAEEVRESDEDFATDVRGEEASEDDDDDGLSTLEKALLVGLGAVAVGSLLDNGQEVVANSGDRVVAREESGDYVVYRDDDALLRQEGATVRTQTFDDGSTRTIVERGDGTQIVTIRDAAGRVLRRARVLSDGTQVLLLDDTVEVEPVDVRQLREAAPAPVIISAEDIGAERLREVLAEPVAYDPGRRFTLRQIREIAAVRNLVPGIDLDAITFASGSAAIPSDQLGDLVDLGLVIEDALAQDPSEVFLVEGHTDAVGGEAYNLALSDRRAETVALALTENFAIPPENLVVQGYGEEFLKVPTLEDEQENRRATIRRITPLLQLRG